jgi:dihydrofolate synthase/folylpolyglutamate synthase
VEFLGSILSTSGANVGTYFSPQIEKFPERFRINGENANELEITDAYLQVKRICKENKLEATFFEVVTAMAFIIFKARGVQFAVLEVGLGGRLDAVNAVEPEISAITSISLEHTDVLGDTVEKIAHEKCGIARKGKKLVCGTLGPVEKAAVISECKSLGAKPLFIQGDVKISGLKERGSCYSFRANLPPRSYPISLSAPGRFQVSNACVALACAHFLGMGKKTIENGLHRTAPKFRLQKISSAPNVLADCCHNPGAAFALASELRHISGNKILLFGAMKDKDYKKVLDILRPFFSKIMLTQVSLDRAAKLPELQAAASSVHADAIGVKKPAAALAAAKRLAGKKGTVVITGSIYLLAELYGKDKIRMAQ